MKKFTSLMLVLILILGLAACGNSNSKSAASQETESEETAADTKQQSDDTANALRGKLSENISTTKAAQNRTEGVISGKSVFIHPNGVAFWGSDTMLCSGLIDENHQIYDFADEATLPATIQTIAVEDNYMYLGTHDGLFKLNLEERTQEQSVALMLHDGMLIAGFHLYDGYAYYLSGSSLYRVPTDSGEEEKLLTGVNDFELTNEGIYYTDENGGLFMKPLDGSQRALLTDTDPESRVVLYNNFLYFWGKGSDKDCIYRYSLTDTETETIEFNEDFDPGTNVWITDEYILYESEDYDTYKYDLATGKETLMDKIYGLPSKESATFQNDILYYSIGSKLYWDNALNNTEESVDMDNVLTVSQNNSSTVSVSNSAAGNNSNNAAGSSNTSANSDSYNIAENITVQASEGNAFVVTTYFTLYMPISGGWNWEVIDNETIMFYCESAREAGYGGHLVTIKAYDWGDNAYEEFPAWTVAGLSEDKKYIAIFPTDVQFDPSNSAQAEEYQSLLEFVRRIDNEGDQNPFFPNP